MSEANDIARTALLMASLPSGTNMLDATVLPINQNLLVRLITPYNNRKINGAHNVHTNGKTKVKGRKIQEFIEESIGDLQVQ